MQLGEAPLNECISIFTYCMRHGSPDLLQCGRSKVSASAESFKDDSMTRIMLSFFKPIDTEKTFMLVGCADLSVSYAAYPNSNDSTGVIL